MNILLQFFNLNISSSLQLFSYDIRHYYSICRDIMIFTSVLLGLLLTYESSILNVLSHDNFYESTIKGCVCDSSMRKYQPRSDMKENRLKDVALSLLKFDGLDSPLRSTYIANNGNIVTIRFNNSESIMITGGPLGTDHYVFEQLYFDLFDNDSENLANAQSFKMELDVIFWGKKYGSVLEAAEHADGLTVLAYSFELNEYDDDNPTYKPIVDIVSTIKSSEPQIKLLKSLNYKFLLNPEYVSIQNYITYMGSLISPPCFVDVMWIKFQDPVRLSVKQMSAFEKLWRNNGVPYNSCPIWILKDRPVFHNVVTVDNKNHNNSEHFTFSISLLLSYVAIILTVYITP